MLNTNNSILSIDYHSLNPLYRSLADNDYHILLLTLLIKAALLRKDYVRLGTEFEDTIHVATHRDCE
jgi:hypothetical protein